MAQVQFINNHIEPISNYGRLELLVNSCSSESENEAELQDDISRLSQLRKWALTHNITHPVLRDLLEICRKWLPRYGFPSDPRTLLKTKRIVQLQDIDGGQFYHFGLEVGLVKILCHKEFAQLNISKVEVSLGIDGLPISKSSKLQFWPILCKIYGSLGDNNVFIVSLFCGTQKPKSLQEFLNPLVREIVNLNLSGVVVGDKKYQFILKAIIADDLARSFITQVKGHNAYYGCERCYAKGEYSGRLIYPVGQLYPLIIIRN